MSSGVEFDEDSFGYGTRQRSSGGSAGTPGTAFPGAGRDAGGGSGSNEPKMVQWLMARGWAKSPAVAQGMLVAFIIINLIITFIVIKYLL